MKSEVAHMVTYIRGAVLRRPEFVTNRERYEKHVGEVFENSTCIEFLGISNCHHSIGRVEHIPWYRFRCNCGDTFECQYKFIKVKTRKERYGCPKCRRRKSKSRKSIAKCLAGNIWNSALDGYLKTRKQRYEFTDWETVDEFAEWFEKERPGDGCKLRKFDAQLPYSKKNLFFDDGSIGSLESPSTLWRKHHAEPDCDFNERIDFIKHVVELGFGVGKRVFLVDSERGLTIENIRVEPSRKNQEQLRLEWVKIRFRSLKSRGSKWRSMKAWIEWCDANGVQAGDRIFRPDTSKPWGPKNITHVPMDRDTDVS